jgi:hypothetical protein
MTPLVWRAWPASCPKRVAHDALGWGDRVIVALVSAETVLLVVVLVLVAGLLRSNAELLRRVGRAGDEATSRFGERGAVATAQPADLAPPPPPDRRSTRAAPVAGTTPDGDAIKLDFDGGVARPTLLAFLSSGCTSCAEFWETLAEPLLTDSVQTVIVTHGPDRERRARLRALAPEGVPVVMSSQAWDDYGVPGSPYFVLVDGAIAGEGVATTWPALSSLVNDAIEDQPDTAAPTRAQTIEATLAAAGIGPSHPSLRPATLPMQHSDGPR